MGCWWSSCVESILNQWGIMCEIFLHSNSSPARSNSHTTSLEFITTCSNGGSHTTSLEFITVVWPTSLEFINETFNSSPLCSTGKPFVFLRSPLRASSRLNKCYKSLLCVGNRSLPRTQEVLVP